MLVIIEKSLSWKLTEGLDYLHFHRSAVESRCLLLVMHDMELVSCDLR